MPGGLVLAGGRLLLGIAKRKLAKKLTRKAIATGAGAIATGVAVDRITNPTTIFGRGGGGQKINFPSNISPFEPGRGMFGKSSARGRVEAGEMGACPKGYHLNKNPLQDGTPARTVCVRNRTINYANGRAARRAGRRLRGTVKMLKRSFSLVTGKAPRGKFIPRKK